MKESKKQSKKLAKKQDARKSSDVAQKSSIASESSRKEVANNVKKTMAESERLSERSLGTSASDLDITVGEYEIHATVKRVGSAEAEGTSQEEPSDEEKTPLQLENEEKIKNPEATVNEVNTGSTGSTDSAAGISGSKPDEEMSEQAANGANEESGTKEVADGGKEGDEMKPTETPVCQGTPGIDAPAQFANIQDVNGVRNADGSDNTYVVQGQDLTYRVVKKPKK